MLVDIPYGNKTLKLDIKHQHEILIPKKLKLKDERVIIKSAFEKPLDSQSFEDFINKSDKILFIVNDGTRPTPTSKILDFLYPKISSIKDVKFIIAVGSHKASTDAELKKIFGKYYEIFKEKIIIHDSRNEKNLKYFGKTSRGTEVFFNKIIDDFNSIILINSVEPHYFAGYTGGRKSFLPGIAGFKTIEMNHKHALEKSSATLCLEGNPVHEDMMETIGFLKHLRIFSIQIVLTPDAKIFQITTGELNQSFLKAIDYANDIFCVKLKTKGNIVITAAPAPMDIDLYQSQKALENGKLALVDNGIIILVSECANGIGDQVFYDLLSKALKPNEVINFLNKEYELGYHKAAKIAELATKSQIWAVTSLDESILEKAFIRKCKNIKSALDEAVELIEKRGETPKVVVLPYGSLTVPNCVC
jgi:nickel-dependent lactate racemase